MMLAQMVVTPEVTEFLDLLTGTFGSFLIAFIALAIGPICFMVVTRGLGRFGGVGMSKGDVEYYRRKTEY